MFHSFDPRTFIVKSVAKTIATLKRKNSAPSIIGNNGDLKFHPFANIFPLLGEEELLTLSQDIIDNGLRFPITLHEGMILDGRNRYSACVMANIKPQFIDYDGDDAVKFVVSTNLHRRHLNESQRAMVAADLETMKQGRPHKDANLHLNENVSRDQSATLLCVGTRSVATAKKVKTEAVPEVIDAVRSGKLPVSVAATIAEATPDQQREVIAKDDKKAILAASKPADFVPMNSWEQKEPAWVQLLYRCRSREVPDGLPEVVV